jgi:hypothetical protein
MEIYHQLMVFEAFEHGLLAMWETPGALACVQSSVDQSPIIEVPRVGLGLL